MTPAQALAAGAAARTAGLPSLACPHPAGELRAAWVRGWVRQRTTDLYGVFTASA